jgi:hypothetical protein
MRLAAPIEIITLTTHLRDWFAYIYIYIYIYIYVGLLKRLFDWFERRLKRLLPILKSPIEYSWDVEMLLSSFDAWTCKQLQCKVEHFSHKVCFSGCSIALFIVIINLAFTIFNFTIVYMSYIFLCDKCWNLLLSIYIYIYIYNANRLTVFIMRLCGKLNVKDAIERTMLIRGYNYIWKSCCRIFNYYY